jgi:hypothetical protein
MCCFLFRVKAIFPSFNCNDILKKVLPTTDHQNYQVIAFHTARYSCVASLGFLYSFAVLKQPQHES